MWDATQHRCRLQYWDEMHACTNCSLNCYQFRKISYKLQLLLKHVLCNRLNRCSSRHAGAEETTSCLPFTIHTYRPHVHPQSTQIPTHQQQDCQWRRWKGENSKIYKKKSKEGCYRHMVQHANELTRMSPLHLCKQQGILAACTRAHFQQFCLCL